MCNKFNELFRMMTRRTGQDLRASVQALPSADLRARTF